MYLRESKQRRADAPEVVERLRRLAKSILRRCSLEEIVGAGGDWHLICAWPYGDLLYYFSCNELDGILWCCAGGVARSA